MRVAISAPAWRASSAADRFPYARFHADLVAQPPRWPKATDRLATLRLELAYRTRSLVLRQMQPVQHLTLEIIDYPGEWLLDLPLLEQSYEQFSLAALALAEQSGPACGRRRLAEPARAPSTPTAPADEGSIAALAEAYRDYLARVPARAGPEPGAARAVHQSRRSRGIAAAALLPAAARRDSASGSNRARMAERYERYREEVVRRFYEEHFARFDRQIVLVDLLGASTPDPEHFADTEQSLEVILRSFRYGSTGLLGRLFSPRIDRLLFAVSKADHVAPEPASGAQAAARADDPAGRACRPLRGHQDRGA